MESKDTAINFFKDLATAAIFGIQSAGVGMLTSWAGRNVFAMDASSLISSAGYVAGGTVGLAIVAGSVSKLYYEAYEENQDENTGSKRGLYGMVVGGTIGFTVTQFTKSCLPVSASLAIAAIGILGSVGSFFAVKQMQMDSE